jgi:serine phosphatase RsbU (regulator of sigma subunit)
MKNFLIFYFLLISQVILFAQANKNGVPFIMNYTPKVYDASEQNWDICQDNRGVMYVGNNDNGILEFDGKNWKKIPISNNSIVRSVAYSNDGSVYVGGVEEFGYLAPDLQGQMHYRSLTDQLDSVDFKDVWKIFIYDNEVYFSTQYKIYKFINKELIKVYINDAQPFLSFMVGNKIYWGTYDEGLNEVYNDSVVQSIGGDFYREKDVFVMLPWDKDEILICTITQGVYIYNEKTGLSKSFSSLGDDYQNLNNELKQSQIYTGALLKNGKYALATLNNGCLIFNRDGEFIYKLNKDNGLQDNTVINLFEDKIGNLWMGLNKGISVLENNSPFTRLGSEYGIDGIITSLIEYKDNFYMSTNINLLYLRNVDNTPKFEKVDLDADVFCLKKFIVPNTNEEKLIVATHLGIWELKSPNQEPDYISGDEYKSDIIYQSKLYPELLYVGHMAGLSTLEFKNGNWIDLGKHEGVTKEIESIAEDEYGNLWLGTVLNGVIKISSKNIITNYLVKDGLPDVQENRVYNIQGGIVCATYKGLYGFNYETNSFEKYGGFGEKYFLSTDQIRRIDFFKEKEYWIVGKDKKTEVEYLEKLTITQDRIITIEDIPFKRLVNNSFQQVYSEDDSNVWIATTDALYNYKNNIQEDYSSYFQSLVRKVEIGIDSVVFNGTYFLDAINKQVSINQPKELKIVVPYKDRSFRFFYSTPYFPNTEVTYSSKLLGFDDNWSAWSEKTDRPYTNLNEGKYTFLVKAKNIYGIESETAKYEFTIKPPWYKTIVAFIFYVILAVFVIVIIVKIYTRRLEQEKIRLEQIVKERTEEVVKQKEEIEGQRDEISAKNKSITDSIEYAKRIQTAILPSEEFAKEFLPEHFILFRPRDIVSGDFYWMTKKDNLLVLIAADCTGHGVPGAFMSMLGVSFLNEIVNRHNVTTASEILNSLRTDIKKTLGQEGKEGEAKDGMDIALCILDLENMKMQYSGAYNPLYLFRNNEFIEVKADRMPIGIYIKEKDSFTNNEIDLQKGDVFYIFSDGFQDQFGGEDGQKFKTKNYKKLLLEIHQKPMAEQREILDSTVDTWRGEWEQVDDIIIMGIRV